jgi:hypothetical protein
MSSGVAAVDDEVTGIESSDSASANEIEDRTRGSRTPMQALSALRRRLSDRRRLECVPVREGTREVATRRAREGARRHTAGACRPERGEKKRCVHQDRE